MDRACRALIHSVHTRARDVLGDQWGNSALDAAAKPTNTFPTQEIVDDAAMRLHIIQVEHHVKEGAPGWTVPAQHEAGGSSPETSPAKSAVSSPGPAKGRRGRRGAAAQ